MVIVEKSDMLHESIIIYYKKLICLESKFSQVHRAILHNGEKVVVKVQRPGLKKLFDIDLRK